MEKNSIVNKKIFIVIISILAVMLCISMMILNFMELKKDRIKQAEITGNFNSVKDILEYYGCKHIKTEKSEIEGFSVDIYTNFKYDLYDEEKSNENFYNQIIEKIAYVQNYENYRLIDETKDEKIEIKVFCEEKSVKKIVINGIEDYFIYMDSKIDAEKYSTIEEIDVQIEAPEILKCIENNWDKTTEFGTREAIFQKYYLYFDEGISVRKISGKIYNIVFTDKYSQSVINGLTVNSDKDLIKEKLGEPAFKNKNGTLIGYKCKDIYVFFANNEISIYRNTSEDYEKFFGIIDKFLDKEYTFLEFMNELTYIWPDYETYEYSEDSVFISYPNKGIDVKINYEDEDGIVIYNNIGIEKELIKKYLEHTEFISNRKIDNIYNAELRRFSNQNKLNQKCIEYESNYEKEDKRNKGEIYKYYMDFDNSGSNKAMYFISQSEDYFNNQLIENIDSYIWINDTTIVYSKANRGIYKFDLLNGEKAVLQTGDDSFQINSYENGILTYDYQKIINL